MPLLAAGGDRFAPRRKIIILGARALSRVGNDDSSRAISISVNGQG
jgi:hypothetical protein